MGYEPQIRGLGLNTVLTAFAVLMLAIVGYMSRRIYEDTASTHDAVITINATMVKQSELQTVKAQIASLEQKQVELQHAQDQMSLDIRRIRQTTVVTPPASK